MAASLEEYEARIAALERKVGQLKMTMENDLLKLALPSSRSPSGAKTSFVSVPPASPPRTVGAALELDAEQVLQTPRRRHRRTPPTVRGKHAVESLQRHARLATFGLTSRP